MWASRTSAGKDSNRAEVLLMTTGLHGTRRRPQPVCTHGGLIPARAVCASRLRLDSHRTVVGQKCRNGCRTPSTYYASPQASPLDPRALIPGGDGVAGRGLSGHTVAWTMRSSDSWSKPMSRPGDLDRRLLLIRDRMLDGCPEMARLARLLQGVSALVLVLSVACVPSWLAQVPVGSPSPTPLPDTSAQQAVVHQYLDLVAAERYADAWQLLTPERQRRETP